MLEKLFSIRRFMSKIVVIGGGAAGIFAAIAAKSADPKSSVKVLEKTAVLLSKVKISGGGRCNATHACFEPKELIKNYPRGSKELLGPFHTFQPRDIIKWFEAHGVTLKVEEDGRMFPITDSSSTIIECLLREADRLSIDISLRQRIEKVEKIEDRFKLTFADQSQLDFDKLILATGSSPQGHQLARELGHSIEESVPSLFTFNIQQFPLVELAGISLKQARVTLKNSSFSQTGPLLITHWGFSGPAVLKLSAWAARYFYEKKYNVELVVDWIPECPLERLFEEFTAYRQANPTQAISNCHLIHLPKNLWKKLIERSAVAAASKMNDLSNKAIKTICTTLKEDPYLIEGKTTHKEEFVTCGGVRLKEVNFKTMESRICPSLYFAGEVLDIDAVTGGFNFQNAWTTGWIAGHASVGA